MQRLTNTLLSAALLVLVGCAAPLPTTTTANTPESVATVPAAELTAAALVDSSWQLATYGAPDAQITVIGATPITLVFGNGGQVSGDGGCNAYSGTYQVADNTLAFGEMVSTLRACVDADVTDQEQEYLQALQSAGRFERTAEVLAIWYDNQASVLNFVPAANTGG